MSKSKHYYGFVKYPNHWADDNDKVYKDEFFNNKIYEDFYFDNFYDMDAVFGSENSLFGTKGLPVGHPNRSSRSFDQYNKEFGPIVVRVVKNDDNLQENIFRIKEVMGIIHESSDGHKKNINAFQKFIDSRIENFKEICETMQSEDDEIISFSACDFIDVLEKISITDVKMYDNNKLALLVVIKYKNYFYLDEDSLIMELQNELNKWFNNVKIEVEDTINTFPHKMRNW